MEQVPLINEIETAKSRLVELEKSFHELSENYNLSEPEFYVERTSIDAEISKIYDKFPDLEEWNENK